MVLPTACAQPSRSQDTAVIPGGLFLLGSVKFLAGLHFCLLLLVSQSYLSLFNCASVFNNALRHELL